VSYLREFSVATLHSKGPVVFGLGNSMAGDDSVGIQVIRALRNERVLDCELLELRQPGVDLLRFCERESWVLFVDGVSSGASAGTIHLIPLPSAEIQSRNIGALSSHGFGLPEIMELCRVLARALPRLMLLGIEIEAVEPGERLTKNVQHAMQAVLSNFSSLMQVLNAQDSLVWKQPHRYCPEEFRFIVSLCGEAH